MTRIATLLPENTKRIFPFHVIPHLDEDSQVKYGADEESGNKGVFVPVGTDLKSVQELLIRETLDYTNGNKTKAATLLGVSLRNLRRKLNK
jgi:DNA-binding NtrC family response regulator